MQWLNRRQATSCRSGTDRTASDAQHRLGRSHFLVLNLNRHMIDLEFLLENGLCVHQDCPCVFHVGDNHVAGQ